MDMMEWLKNINKKDKILSLIMLIVFILSIVILVFMIVKNKDYAQLERYISFLIIEFVTMIIILSIRIQKTWEE